MKNHLISRRCGALLLALALAASLATPALADTDTITLKPDDKTVTMNDTTTLSIDSINTGDAADFTLVSSDTSVVTVDGSGHLASGHASATVTAVGPGKATITLTTTGEATPRTATCTVTVPLTINTTTLSLTAGETAQLTTNATSGVTWASDDSTVVSVNADGLVTAHAVGGPIEIIGTKGDLHVACSVTVEKVTTTTAVTDVTLSTATWRVDDLSDTKSNPTQVTAYILPSDADVESVDWTSSDPCVSVQAGEIIGNQSTATVTALAPGTGTVTATAGGKSDSFTFTVSGVRLTDDTSEDSLTELTLYEGRTKSLNYMRFGSADGTDSALWTSSNSSVVSVSGGNLFARSLGTATITIEVGSYTAKCTVTVVENTLTNLTRSMTAGETLSFSDLRAELNSKCLANTDGDDSTRTLQYITNLYVSPDQGTLYYNYSSTEKHGLGVGATEKYYYTPSAGARGIADLTFVPNSDFQGVAAIRYTGYNLSGETFSGEIRVTVSPSADVVYATVPDTPVTFQAEDFSDVCMQKTGLDLDYVTFLLPAASQGVLYYNYSTGSQYAEKVTAGTAYYRARSPMLDRVTFLPTSGYSGTVSISYRATDVSGASYSGTITVTISGSAGLGDVSYSGARGVAIPFAAADFNSACWQAIGQSLNYVQFELPSSSQGTLYTDYLSGSGTGTPVSGSTRYTRSGTGSTSISAISFVPAADAGDTVTISFTATGVSGGRYDGQVRVSLSAGSDGQLFYLCQQGDAVALDSADFNAACRAATGASLDYIRFETLPSEDQGELTYSTRSGSTRAVTVSSTFFRAGGSRLIDGLTFTPVRGYAGTVHLRFIGYDIDGVSFTGTVRIEVSQVVGTSGIYYAVLNGCPVTFRASDFELYCQGATGAALSYVRFSLPVPTCGVLYDSYSESRASNARVLASTSYSPTGGAWLLDNVTFLASNTFAGTVEIPFTGHNVLGSEFQGVVTIRVCDTVQTRVRYTSSGLPTTVQAADLRQVCTEQTGASLSYIRFTALPDADCGQLYLGYSGPFTGVSVRTNVDYYDGGVQASNRLIFVPKAGFQGTATLYYTGVNVSGGVFVGSVSITVSPGSTTSSFSDLGSYRWAASSVAFLADCGVVNGVGDGRYDPAQPVQRAAFVTMLCRALSLPTVQGESFPDVPTDSYYAQAAATAKVLGIVQGSDGLFHPDQELTRQDAMVLLYRAAQLSDMSLPAPQSDLSAFSDASQVASYARDAVSVMTQLGVLQGNTSGQLCPNASITRAEIAVILHRLLTL
jgi:uncharacterized protein YjdB